MNIDTLQKANDLNKKIKEIALVIDDIDSTSMQILVGTNQPIKLDYASSDEVSNNCREQIVNIIMAYQVSLQNTFNAL